MTSPPSSSGVPPLTIFVDSTDSYADCWDPFFTLFADAWPDCPHPILLNTNRSDYAFDGLDITATRNHAGEPADRHLPWGTCLRRGLSQVTTPHVLYMLDDMFLEAPVRVDVLHELLGVVAERGLGCLRLVEPGNSGPWAPTDHPLVWEVQPSSQYLVSAQAAIWDVAFLHDAVRPHESPWQFEIWGSARLRRQGRRTHAINRDVLGDMGSRVTPYRPSGVIKGRWAEDIVVDLFARHDIDVDFAERGFYEPGVGVPGRQPLLQRAWARVRSLR